VINILIRCAWCKIIIGDKPPFGAKYDQEVTDGICDACLTYYFPHHADKIRSCLEVEKIEEIFTGGDIDNCKAG